MNEKVIFPKQEYDDILVNVVNCIEKSKQRAFAEVNKALLNAYWNIGKVLSGNASYGKSVVEQLSGDLRLKYPNTRGYSVRNLWNMKKFYDTYQKLQTVSAELLFSISWNEKESIGLILCKSKNHEEVRFALAKTMSPIKVANYKTKLPDKEIILKRLEQFRIESIEKDEI